ncbi:hypothetical protein OSB04_030742 [Centaurea solstitialis]|uniref:Retrotransposon gag domain-containing protein n=1 Tax=Centaurea solstitialis TaxID=347529 RepID=A0AA38W5B0_9ASTR|nr:hypothetical protein OSB04_030742 [Centaurea solstitialis]
MIKDLTFNGTNDSNPIVHMENFVDICDLFKTEECRDDAIRLRIDKLRADIRSFQQDDGETISEAWERFKHLLNSCPSHGLNKSEQVQTFYSGLAYSSRATLDSSAGGVFMYKTPTEGYKLLEDMLIHNIDWRTDKRLQIPRMAGKILTDFDPSDELAAMKNQQVGCEECNGPHLTKDCPNRPMMTPGSERIQGELPTQTQVNPKVENVKPMLMMTGEPSKKKWTDIYTKKYVESDSGSEPDYATDYDSEGFTISFEHLGLKGPVASSDDEEEDGKQGGYAEFVIPKKEDKGKEKEKEKALDDDLIYIAPIKHDPGSYNLPISCHKFQGLALVDSGAALNMMPVGYCRKMGVKKIIPTDYQYRGVNGYMTKPLGIAEGVPIRIGNFVYYTDFVIANLPQNTEIPIILGRSFLHTASSFWRRCRVRHLDEPYEDPSLAYKKSTNRPLLPHERGKTTEDYPNPIRQKEQTTNGSGPSKKEFRKKRGSSSRRDRRKNRANPTRDRVFEKLETEANSRSPDSKSGDAKLRQRTRSSTSTATNFRAPDGSHVFTYFMNDPNLNAPKREEYRDTVNRLLARQVLIPRRVDWDLLRSMSVENNIKAILEKHAYDEDSTEYYICHAWERVFDIAETLYRELIVEFVATFRFEAIKALEEFHQSCMTFRLGGVWRSLSLVDFAVALGIYTQEEVDVPDSWSTCGRLRKGRMVLILNWLGQV